MEELVDLMVMHLVDLRLPLVGLSMVEMFGADVDMVVLVVVVGCIGLVEVVVLRWDLVRQQRIELVAA